MSEFDKGNILGVAESNCKPAKTDNSEENEDGQKGEQGMDGEKEFKSIHIDTEKGEQQ